MKKMILIFASMLAVFAHGAANDASSQAIRTLLNTRSSSSPKAFEAAAKIVARDAENGRVLQRFIVALFSQDRDAPRVLHIGAAKRKEYFDSSREKIRNLAINSNNGLAYYLLSMESNDIGLLRKAADGGNPQAMNAYATYYLGKALKPGASTNEVDLAMREGYKYFSRAADQDDANGLYNLGMCYMRGYYVTPDPVRARECFFRAAKMGHPEAINNIGGFYRDGITLEQDPVEAARWFAKSADLGNSYGELNYAIALLNGEGVVKDEERAVRILKSSAQNGNIEAMNLWGVCLHSGRGTEKNVQAAIRLYRKAADGGLAAAMDNYADCYEQGDGIPQNQEAANIWRMKARAARGDRNAAAWLVQSGVE